MRKHNEQQELFTLAEELRHLSIGSEMPGGTLRRFDSLARTSPLTRQFYDGTAIKIANGDEEELYRQFSTLVALCEQLATQRPQLIAA